MQIDGITINNFKNVEHGDISFENTRCSEGANVLALYGQNGSGKTALVDSIVLLRKILDGEAIPYKFGSYVTEGAENAEIEYRFHRKSEKNGKVYRISYRLSFSANKEPGDILKFDDEQYRCPLLTEVLSYGYESANGEKKRLHTAASVDSDRGLSPGAFERLIKLLQTGSCKAAHPNTEPPFNTEVDRVSPKEGSELCEKDLSSLFPEASYLDKLSSGKSFLFSEHISDAIGLFCDDEDLLFVYRAVKEAANKLGIASTEEASLLDSNRLPLYLFHPSLSECDNRPIPFELQIGPDPYECSTINEEEANQLKQIENGLKTIVNAIVPGLNISFDIWGSYGDEMSLQVYSNRNNHPIPLACESNGVKRIVSIAMLLVNAFNDPDYVAVIDEFDAGVFEYLLGEILEVFQENGKGQLIFTSHNLRPLEKLNKNSIVFTTTNPTNRYIRMKNVKSTNNLRDMYIRAITLGGQDEELYKWVNEDELTEAFELAYLRG